jgi:hypothetical protein
VDQFSPFFSYSWVSFTSRPTVLLWRGAESEWVAASDPHPNSERVADFRVKTRTVQDPAGWQRGSEP